MRIYINARWLLNSPTGVERYAYEISRALHKEGADVVLICPQHGTIHTDYHIEDIPLVRFGMGHSHIWEQLVLPWFFIGKKDYILLSLMGLGSMAVRKKISTVHDLSFLYEPGWFSRSYYHFYRLMTPLAIRTSQAILTVSRFSKSEICRFYPWLRPEKIHVIYNAVDTQFFHPGEQEHKDYLLAVASLDPRKNLERVNRAHFGSGIPFQLAGGSGRAFANRVQEATEMTLLGKIDAEKLRTCYQEAQGLVYVSLYEGFGLPPIEAMACGCPVLAADIPVLREVCQDAAIYCDPQNEQSIREGLNRLAQMNEEERQEMVARGLTNIQRFSWQKSAQKIRSILA